MPNGLRHLCKIGVKHELRETVGLIQRLQAPELGVDPVFHNVHPASWFGVDPSICVGVDHARWFVVDPNIGIGVDRGN